MKDGIPMMDKKQSTIGDYMRSGSCIGEPQVMSKNSTVMNCSILLNWSKEFLSVIEMRVFCYVF